MRKVERAGKGSKTNIVQTVWGFECAGGVLSPSFTRAFQSTRFFCGTDTFRVLSSAAIILSVRLLQRFPSLRVRVAVPAQEHLRAVTYELGFTEVAKPRHR